MTRRIQNLHPSLEETINVAEEISFGCGQSQIRIEAFAGALFRDEGVQDFFHSQNIEASNIYSSNLEHIAFKPPRTIEASALELSPQLRRLLVDLNKFFDNKDPTMSPLHGLIALNVVLKNAPASPSTKLLEDQGIKSASILKYITSYKAQLDVFLPTPVETSYEYVIEQNSESALSEYTTCLNDLAHDNKLNPTIGREDEIASVIRILRRKSKNNPMLLGKPGVGKTAIPEGIAQLAINGKLPADLEHIKIFNLDLAALVAGTMYRGDFEKRIKSVISEISQIDHAVLFVDEIHQLVGAGRAGGAMDASNILKPALARGEIACIGATTFDEYRIYIEKDQALARRFKVIDVEEPSAEETLEILVGIKSQYEDFHYCSIPDEALQYAVDMSDRYITDRNFPDKAIDLIDEAGALMKEIPRHNLYFGEAANLPILTKDIISTAIAKTTGLPLEKISADDSTKILSLESELSSVIYGQTEAVKELSEAYKVARSGIGDPNKPIASYLFSGPTGVGKTELTKQLSELLDMNMIRIDMSEFMEAHSVSKLIGPPPGYVGYNEGGMLTDPVHLKGHSVILLDEIEKAHPDVHNILLQIMDHGCLTDSTGKSVNFRNTILIMTTNAGAGGSIVRSIGFGQQETSSTKDGEIEKIFSPEFRNRLDGEIKFNSLGKDIMPQIIGNIVSDLEKQLKEKNVSLSLTQEATEWLVENGFDEKMGARPLRRIFEKEVKRPIAHKLLEAGSDTSGAIIVSTKDSNLSFSFEGAVSNDNSDKVEIPTLQPLLLEKKL